MDFAASDVSDKKKHTEKVLLHQDARNRHGSFPGAGSLSADTRAVCFSPAACDDDFFIYVRKLHRTMHFFTVLGLLIALYAVMMGFFKYSDADTIVQSWSGIYQNPDSYKSNPALANTVDESHAMNCLEITKTLLKDCIFAFIPHLFIAAAFPFIVLLLSGITVVHSASSRARKTRCLLLIASVCPLGLCLVGFDYGRWFSFCAMNLMVYSLFIAHKAGRIKSASSAPELIRKIKGAAKQCAVIAVGIILLNYRLGVNGYFDESGLTISDETKVIIDSSSRMFRDLAPLVNRERLIQPKKYCQVTGLRAPAAMQRTSSLFSWSMPADWKYSRRDCEDNFQSGPYLDINSCNEQR